jgi:hypothetical protein
MRGVKKGAEGKASEKRHCAHVAPSPGLVHQQHLPASAGARSVHPSRPPSPEPASRSRPRSLHRRAASLLRGATAGAACSQCRPRRRPMSEAQSPQTREQREWGEKGRSNQMKGAPACGGRVVMGISNTLQFIQRCAPRTQQSPGHFCTPCCAVLCCAASPLSWVFSFSNGFVLKTKKRQSDCA